MQHNVCTHVAMYDFITFCEMFFLFLQYSLRFCDFGVKEAKMLGDFLSHTSWIQSIE